MERLKWNEVKSFGGMCALSMIYIVMQFVCGVLHRIISDGYLVCVFCSLSYCNCFIFFIIRFIFVFLFCMFCFLISVLCFCIVLFLLMYIVVSVLFVYTFADHYHRVETQLHSFNKYRIIYIRT